MGKSFKKGFVLLFVVLLLAVQSYAKSSYIATQDIKVRASKGKNFKIIGTIKKRSTVEVTEIDDVWWRVTYNDQDGYVLGKYLKEAPENIPVPTVASVTNGSWFDDIGITTIAIGIGIILAIIVAIRMIRNYIAAKRARAAYRPPAEKVIRITHWYQCKHCSAAIKKDTEPNIAGCSQSLRHLWINLGEIGDLKYICKGCSTILMVKNEPPMDGCPNADQHVWKKL